jgi:hypothetical protein
MTRCSPDEVFLSACGDARMVRQSADGREFSFYLFPTANFVAYDTECVPSEIFTNFADTVIERYASADAEPSVAQIVREEVERVLCAPPYELSFKWSGAWPIFTYLYTSQVVFARGKLEFHIINDHDTVSAQLMSEGRAASFSRLGGFPAGYAPRTQAEFRANVVAIVAWVRARWSDVCELALAVFGLDVFDEHPSAIAWPRLDLAALGVRPRVNEDWIVANLAQTLCQWVDAYGVVHVAFQDDVSIGFTRVDDSPVALAGWQTFFEWLRGRAESSDSRPAEEHLVNAARERLAGAPFHMRPVWGESFDRWMGSGERATFANADARLTLTRRAIRCVEAAISLRDATGAFVPPVALSLPHSKACATLDQATAFGVEALADEWALVLQYVASVSDFRR